MKRKRLIGLLLAGALALFAVIAVTIYPTRTPRRYDVAVNLGSVKALAWQGARVDVACWEHGDNNEPSKSDVVSRIEVLAVEKGNDLFEKQFTLLVSSSEAALLDEAARRGTLSATPSRREESLLTKLRQMIGLEKSFEIRRENMRGLGQ